MQLTTMFSMTPFWKFLLLVLAVCCTLNVTAEQINNNNAFVATHEWQAVTADQQLPPGLHIQIDMSTGQRQAKIADINDNTNNQMIVSERTDNQPHTVKLHIDDTTINNVYNQQLDTNSDTYTVQQLLSLIVNPSVSHDIVLSALELLDDKVSDIDVSKHFIEMHGTMPILAILDTDYTDLTNTELNNLINLQLQSIKLMTSLCQNNPHVKQYIHDNNYMTSILRYIDTTQYNINTDTQLQLLNRALTCIAVMIDNDSKIQEQFIENNGWKQLYDLHNYINSIEPDNVNQQQYNKLINRLLNVQYDMLTSNNIANITHDPLHNTWCSTGEQQLAKQSYSNHQHAVNQLKQLYNTRCYAYA